MPESDERKVVSLGEKSPKVLSYRSPREHEAYTQYLGMVIFLCAWAMLFCGLFMAYGVIRSSTNPWPPEGAPRLPLGLGAVNLVLIGLASAAFHTGALRLRQNQRARAVQAMVLALALGGMFLAVQAAVWNDLYHRGLVLDGGPYPSLIYVITGFHGLHLLFGEGALVYIVARVWRGTFNAANFQPVRLWGMYWHSVAILWGFTFLALYVF
jgi:heme/copper-type cytochrome/quinol oxidase subunit 3